MKALKRNRPATEAVPQATELAAAGVTIPHYISGHYRWAYLWRPGVWFFDHNYHESLPEFASRSLE